MTKFIAAAWPLLPFSPINTLFPFLSFSHKSSYLLHTVQFFSSSVCSLSKKALLGFLCFGSSSPLAFVFFSLYFSETKKQSVDVVMETKGGKKKSSSSSSLQYEVPLGYIIEDVRPNGGIEKFRSAAYSNCVRKPS
ncbi:unnamed protein product, partial [Vitis vinifera]